MVVLFKLPENVSVFYRQRSKPPTLVNRVPKIESTLSHDNGIFHIPCNNKEMVCTDNKSGIYRLREQLSSESGLDWEKE